MTAPVDWTVAEVARAIPPVERRPWDLPAAGDAAWSALGRDDLTGPVLAALHREAAAVRADPLPSLPATAYLAYERTGDRDPYEDRLAARGRRLGLFAVAACLDGDYLDPLLDAAWARCEESTWVAPAHLAGAEGDAADFLAGLPRPVPPAERGLDLYAAETGATLADVDRLLGDRLHPALRERIRQTVAERVVDPYLAREDFRWLASTDNWNAVCNGYALRAALACSPPERAARVAVTAASSLARYFEGFGPDGATPEGVGYWHYGMAGFVAGASAFEAATGGAYSLAAAYRERLRDVVRFPLRAVLAPGLPLPFSDSPADPEVAPAALCWLGDRLDLPGLAARGRALAGAGADSVGGPPGTLRDLVAARRVEALAETAPGDGSGLPLRDFFAGPDWWVDRAEPASADALAVAAKGGHNGEPHNHDDCGAVTVAYRGETPVVDPGPGVYDAGYFGAERSERVAARSLGHSTPRANGSEQGTGAEYAARVVERAVSRERDSIALDLGDCYPAAADLDALRRTVVLDREAGLVRVRDDPSFFGGAGTLESAFVSFLPAEQTEEGVVLDGERTRTLLSVASETSGDGGVETEIGVLEEAVRGRDLTRVCFRSNGTGAIGVTIDPAL